MPELVQDSRIEVLIELEDLTSSGFFTLWLAARVTIVELKERRRKGGAWGKRDNVVLDQWVRLEYDDGPVQRTRLFAKRFLQGTQRARMAA